MGRFIDNVRSRTATVFIRGNNAQSSSPSPSLPSSLSSPSSPSSSSSSSLWEKGYRGSDNEILIMPTTRPSPTKRTMRQQRRRCWNREAAKLLLPVVALSSVAFMMHSRFSGQPTARLRSQNNDGSDGVVAAVDANDEAVDANDDDDGDDDESDRASSSFEQEPEVCYADFDVFHPDDPRREQKNKKGKKRKDRKSTVTQVGPCVHKYQKIVEPVAGFLGGIDYYFFRDNPDEVQFRDQALCFDECMDRHVVPAAEDETGKGGGSGETETETVAADNVMLIEAAARGQTALSERLFVDHGLDPLHRPVPEDPKNSRSLNAIQVAIVGGYVDIVKILTEGNNRLVIDGYGRTVEDYVRMDGSPIRPVDALKVLGIDVDERKTKKRRRVRDGGDPSSWLSSSGWSTETAYPYDEDVCDFDVVDGDLSADDFYKDYFVTGRPVVLRNHVSQKELATFEKNRFISKGWKDYNKLKVGPTAYPSLTDQSYCEKRFTIEQLEASKQCKEMPDVPMVHSYHPVEEDFLEVWPDYNGQVLDKDSSFHNIKRWFGHVVEDHYDVGFQIFFGGDGSGATYHWHTAAFNCLYVGIKEWRIAPPLYRGWSGMPARSVAEKLDDSVTLSCVQKPGDMFYIPNYWGHMTINHGFTIGAAAIIKESYQMGGSKTLREGSGHGGGSDDKDGINKGGDKHKYLNKYIRHGIKGGDGGNNKGNNEVFFVHINKTGGTSMIKMLTDRCEDEYHKDTWYDDNDDFHRTFHLTAHAHIERYGKERWNNADTFAVVRHPLARQVSNFFFLAAKGKECITKGKGKCKERMIPALDLESMSDEQKINAFHEWIRQLHQAFPPGHREHYRFGAAGHGNEVYDTFGSTQTSWLVDPSNQLVVKNIFRLEDISQDMSGLTRAVPCLGKGPVEMDQKNKTPKYPDYTLFAKNEWTRKIINEVFAEDFKNFDYDPITM